MKIKYSKIKKYIAILSCITVSFTLFKFVAVSAEESPWEITPATEISQPPETSDSITEIPITSETTTSAITTPEGSFMGIQAAQATTKEVVIDLSNPWAGSGTDYIMLGSSEIRLNNPAYHYILTNTVGSECYVFVGSGNNYNRPLRKIL